MSLLHGDFLRYFCDSRMQLSFIREVSKGLITKRRENSANLRQNTEEVDGGALLDQGKATLLTQWRLLGRLSS